jgi:hypothetical protein
MVTAYITLIKEVYVKGISVKWGTIVIQVIGIIHEKEARHGLNHET